MQSPVPHGHPTAELNLRDYLSILRKRRMLFAQVFAVVFVVCVVVTFLSKPVYQTSAKVLVQAGSTSVNLVDASNPIATMLQAAQPESVSTQLQRLQSSEFLSMATKNAALPPRPGVMSPSIRVEAIENTNVIRVTGEGGHPEDTARLVNAVAVAHVKWMNGDPAGQLRDTTEFVRRQKDKAARALADAERRLLQFRKEHRLIQLEADQQAQAREYVALQARVDEAGSNITTTRAQLQELQRRLDQEPLEIIQETRRENPRLAKLQERRDDLKLDRADLLREFKPTSPQVRGIDTQIEALEAQIQSMPAELTVRNHLPNERRGPLQSKLAELEAVLRGHQAEFNAARARFQARKGLVDNLGPWEVQQSRLQHDRDAFQEAYTMLSNRLRDLEIRANARVKMADILEFAAAPGAPVRPNKTTNIIFSLVLALCLAAGLAFLQEYLDDRINSPEESERVTTLPSLGQVPMLESGQPQLVAELPGNGRVVESFRALRSSISFAGVDTPLRRILITSAAPGEGKTVTASNLAQAMAMDGKHVILVDADMRRPTIARVLDVAPSPGLAEVLVGQSTIDDVLQHTTTENLRVVSSGAIPPNPSELLGSRSFEQVLEQLEARCDVVLIDSPPCLPVTDPLIIARRADGVVLVVQVGRTKKAELRQMERLLTQAHARIIGVVFNRVSNRHGRQRYYGSYYYYYETGGGSSRNGSNGSGGRRGLHAGDAGTKREQESNR